MSSDEAQRCEDPPITWSEVSNWAECFGWTTLGLWPFLYWVNGPAVSDEQFVVRCVLVGFAACCAVGVRARIWWVSMRLAHSPPGVPRTEN